VSRFAISPGTPKSVLADPAIRSTTRRVLSACGANGTRACFATAA